MTDLGPLPADVNLHPLADHLLAASHEGLDPSLVYVGPSVDGRFELGVKPLDGRHPSELLLGFTADPDWHAIGLLAGGWAYHPSKRGLPPAERHRHRVRIVSLLSRSGELASRLEVEGWEDFDVDAQAGELPTGEQIDLLKRAMRLPTDPPPCGTENLYAIEWLSAILGEDGLQTWDDVVGLHPAVELARSAGLRELDPVRAAVIYAQSIDWGRLHGDASCGRTTAPELAPSDAAWLDVGSFARFVLSRCPPLSMLRRQVGEHLTPDLAARVVAMLDELGIPAVTWPDVEGEEAA